MRLAFQGRTFAGASGSEAASEPLRLPLSRAQQAWRFFRRIATAALIACVCAFAIASAPPNGGAEDSAAPKAESARPSAPLPAWIEIPRPEELFALKAPELAKEARSYHARRHRNGGGRQDVLVFGGATDSAPSLRLTIYRVGDEPAPDASFFVDLARRAAEAGRGISRVAQPTALPTRLGVFEVADLNVTRSGAPESACLGFRLAQAARNLRITGFACGGPEGPLASLASKSALACLLDDVELVPAARDSDLSAFFAARELNGDTACAPSRLDPEPTRSSVLDESGEPPSRHRQIKMR
jgi:hypothetical protein